MLSAIVRSYGTAGFAVLGLAAFDSGVVFAMRRERGRLLRAKVGVVLTIIAAVGAVVMLILLARGSTC